MLKFPDVHTSICEIRLTSSLVPARCAARRGAAAVSVIQPGAPRAAGTLHRNVSAPSLNGVDEGRALSGEARGPWSAGGVDDASPVPAVRAPDVSLDDIFADLPPADGAKLIQEPTLIGARAPARPPIGGRGTAATTSRPPPWQRQQQPAPAPAPKPPAAKRSADLTRDAKQAASGEEGSARGSRIDDASNAAGAAAAAAATVTQPPTSRPLAPPTPLPRPSAPVPLRPERSPARAPPPPAPPHSDDSTMAFIASTRSRRAPRGEAVAAAAALEKETAAAQKRRQQPAAGAGRSDGGSSSSTWRAVRSAAALSRGADAAAAAPPPPPSIGVAPAKIAPARPHLTQPAAAPAATQLPPLPEQAALADAARRLPSVFNPLWHASLHELLFDLWPAVAQAHERLVAVPQGAQDEDDSRAAGRRSSGGGDAAEAQALVDAAYEFAVACMLGPDVRLSHAAALSLAVGIDDSDEVCEAVLQRLPHDVSHQLLAPLVAALLPQRSRGAQRFLAQIKQRGDAVAAAAAAQYAAVVAHPSDRGALTTPTAATLDASPSATSGSASQTSPSQSCQERSSPSFLAASAAALPALLAKLRAMQAAHPAVDVCLLAFVEEHYHNA